MVLAYALKVPEGHYVSVDYVLAVSRFSDTSSSIRDFHFEAGPPRKGRKKREPLKDDRWMSNCSYQAENK